MLLEHDGLDVAGEEATDWKNIDEVEALSYGMNLTRLATFVVGYLMEFDDHDQIEVNDGWDIKRRQLVTRYAHALALGDVYSLRTRAERAAHAEDAL
jgi:hypothetical protein